jgi:parallel beta-helix repeat protein
MLCRLVFAISFLAGFGPLGAQAASTYYVAPTGGSDSNPGTEAAPFATVGKAQSAAAPGDTVLIRGGRFAFSGSGTVGVSFSKSGTSTAPINYFAYPGETPIFDLTNLTPSNRVTGLDVHCNYIHLRGIEVMGVHQYESGSDSWGVRVQGNGNVIENLNVHNNDAPGIFITSGADNLILNCDSHNNYDYLESGGSGDGFGCHSSGGGNVLRGCRAYDNSDDGFDFINAAGSCTVDQSFSFRNGWVPPDSTHGTPGAAAGNGAGFKAGGYGSPPQVPSTGAATHTAQRCVAVGNRAQGFYANHHPGRINFYNNTAYNNPANYNMLSDSGYPSSHVIRNNVAFGTGGTLSNLNGGTATFNSWDLSLAVSTADFQGVDIAEALGPRNPDGSLPNMKLMHLASGSDLIDVGIDVGLPFVGKAPDLGAFEYGALTGTGGTSGTGGTIGAGGATGAGGRMGSGGAAGGTKGSDGAAGSGGFGQGGSTSAASGGVTGAGGLAGATGGASGTGGGAGMPGSDAAIGAGGSGGVGSGGGGNTAGTASGSAGTAGGGVTSTATAGGNGGGSGGDTSVLSAGGTAGSATTSPSKGGCSCNLGRHAAVRSRLAVLALLLLALGLRARRGAR